MQTTHYRVTIDMEEALAKANTMERTALRLAQVQDGKAVPAQMDVWVGSDAARQMAQRLGDEAAMTTTLSHLGTRVQLKAPPAAETVDASGSAQGHSR